MHTDRKGTENNIPMSRINSWLRKQTVSYEFSNVQKWVKIILVSLFIKNSTIFLICDHHYNDSLTRVLNLVIAVMPMGWPGPHQSGALRASSSWIWVIVHITYARKLSAHNSHLNHGNYQLLSLNWALHIFRMWGARFKCLTKTIKIK